MDLANGCTSQTSEKIPTLLAEFQQVQSTRAQTYTLLHEGFREFLKSKDEGPFVRSMADATQVFKRCSQEVIRIEKILRGIPNGGDLADLLRAVQEGERSKLQATMALQSLRRVYEVEKFSWQLESPPQSIIPPADSSSSHHHHHHCDHGEASGVSQVASGISFLNLAGGGSVDVNRVDGGEGGEPSKWDYDGAMGEATRMLDAAVNSINEALEEIRYAQFEMADGEDL